MKSFRPATHGSLLLGALLLLPSFVHAHPGHGAAGFSNGLEHPLSGLDHICAMIAVGLWAAQMGGRALWAVPATFVSVMALGGLLGVEGIPIPFVEQGIVASVLVLGVMIAAAVRLPLVASVALVGLFAICHGYAHGAEMPTTASGLSFGLGFVAATAALHTVGIGLGVAAQRLTKPSFVRLAGVAVVLCGAYLLIS